MPRAWRALEGAAGLFSMQLPARPDDPASEVRTCRLLIEAAARAGVSQIVHTCVARAGDHAAFAGWAEGQWERGYWLGKAAVNELAAGA